MSSHDTGPEENKSVAGHPIPDKGYIADEELPEDVRPSEDNPLAQDPDDRNGDEAPGEGSDGLSRE